jgi:membrane protein
MVGDMLDLPVSWPELLRRTAHEISEDNCLGLAAQLAYYFFLALFPAILFFLALTSYLPFSARLDAALVTYLGPFAPPSVIDIIRQQMQQIAGSHNQGLLTFGVVVALWSSSTAMAALVDALNRAYDVTETRPWWRVRLLSIVLTLVLATLVVAAFVAITVGPDILQALVGSAGVSIAATTIWDVLRYPVGLVLILAAIGLVFKAAPDAKQHWKWLAPGVLLSAALWILASLGFRLYVSNFGSYQDTYGAIGGVMVMMLWFYLFGLSLLIGAELNSEIEHASRAADAKNPGERQSAADRAAAPA